MYRDGRRFEMLKNKGRAKNFKTSKISKFSSKLVRVGIGRKLGLILRNRKRGKTKIRLEIHAVMDLNYTMSIHFRIIINQTADLYPSEIQMSPAHRNFSTKWFFDPIASFVRNNFWSSFQLNQFLPWIKNKISYITYVT